jgi:hypothetical protein
MATATARVLTDHDEIRQWAEARGAVPARVKGTGGKGDVGMIRLDFPGFTGEGKLEPISWDEWFRAFDENGLALIVQDRTASGQRSNFNKLVARETVEGKQPSRRAAGSRGGSGARKAAASGGATRARKSSAPRAAPGADVSPTRKVSRRPQSAKKPSSAGTRAVGRTSAKKAAGASRKQAAGVRKRATSRR